MSIVNSLKSIGTDALLYKIEIHCAFMHMRIDLHLLGLKHDHLLIVHCSLDSGTGPYFSSVVWMPYGILRSTSLNFLTCTTI